MKLKYFVINPYTIYSVMFSISLYLYHLNWSIYNTKLSFHTSIFLLLSIFLSYMMSIFYAIYVQEIHKEVENTGGIFLKKKYIANMNKFIMFGAIISGIYSKGYPLFSSGINYKEFGIPMFHVIWLTVSLLYSLFLFNQIIYKGINYFYMFSIIFSFIPFVLSLNRAMILMIFFGDLCIYFFQKNKKISKKIFLTVILVMVVALYSFGILGNYRINKDYGVTNPKFSDSSLILNIGGATSNFEESLVPNEFFWSYLYLTSPISNLEFNIVNNTSTIKRRMDISDFMGFFIRNFVPDFISKRVVDNNESSKYLVREELNVGTGFYDAYSDLQYSGIYIYIIYLLVFPFMTIYFYRRYCSSYLFIGNSILCIIYSMIFFTNFFSYSGLILPLIYPFIMSLLKKVKV